MFLTAVRHDVNNLESYVVVQELELAINLLYRFFMKSKMKSYKSIIVVRVMVIEKMRRYI